MQGMKIEMNYKPPDPLQRSLDAFGFRMHILFPATPHQSLLYVGEILSGGRGLRRDEENHGLDGGAELMCG